MAVQQSVTHTTIPTQTSQEGNAGAVKTTVTRATGATGTRATGETGATEATGTRATGETGAPEATGTRATGETGATGATGTTADNTVTTRNPSTLTKVVSHTPEPSVAKAGTTSPQPPTAVTKITSSRSAGAMTFTYSLNNGHEKEEEKEVEKHLAEVCRQLMVNLQDGNCTLTGLNHNGKIQFDGVEINGKVKTSLASQYYEEITKKPTDSKTLIAILASSGALLIMIVILAVCASHHRRPYNENQQHLTEELHTVENGYHDNPTLEVMEVQPEMQEKKMTLNGEFNDSWIVPIDNLLKEDVAGEEDTHL